MKQQRQDFCVCCGVPIPTYGLGMVCYECENNPIRPLKAKKIKKPRKRMFRHTGEQTPLCEATPMPPTAR